jgi:hypothetical protein
MYRVSTTLTFGATRRVSGLIVTARPWAIKGLCMHLFSGVGKKRKTQASLAWAQYNLVLPWTYDIMLRRPEPRKSSCPPCLSIASDQETKTPSNKRTTAGCSCSDTDRSVTKPLRHSQTMLHGDFTFDLLENSRKHEGQVRLVAVHFWEFWCYTDSRKHEDQSGYSTGKEH